MYLYSVLLRTPTENGTEIVVGVPLLANSENSRQTGTSPLLKVAWKAWQGLCQPQSVKFRVL